MERFYKQLDVTSKENVLDSLKEELKTLGIKHGNKKDDAVDVQPNVDNSEESSEIEKQP